MIYTKPLKRCTWANSPCFYAYHDEEWGKIQKDEHYLFELLTLEGAQAGLSWKTILKKRTAYQNAFLHFDPTLVSEFGEEKIKKLLANSGIVRSERKIISAIKNAKIFLKVAKEWGSFYNYIWSFTDGKQITMNWSSPEEIPTATSLSDWIAKDMKKRGFSFVGSTIIYAYLQAIGVINDHEISCFCSTVFI